MNAVDTNVLIYARDPRDPRKQAIATELIESLADVFLPWQVACEFVANCGKLAPFGVTAGSAVAELNGLLQVWKTRPPWFPLIGRATELMDARSLSFWDALLIAACLDSGVTRLYTEDMHHGLRIESLEVVNPFRGDEGQPGS